MDCNSLFAKRENSKPGMKALVSLQWQSRHFDEPVWNNCPPGRISDEGLTWGCTRAFINLPHLTWILVIAALVMFPSSARSKPTAKQVKRIYLKAGEVYVINGIASNSTPEVRFHDNPPPFVVNALSATSLQIVGASRGSGTVSVVEQDGKTVDYEFIVQAVVDPANPLTPGASPPTLSDSSLKPRVAGEISVGEAKALDPGSGPLGNVTRPGDIALADAVVEIPSAYKKQESTSSNSGYSGGRANSQKNIPVTPRQTEPQGIITSNGKYLTDPPALPAKKRKDCNAQSGGLPCGMILLMTGTSKVFSFAVPLTRVSIANPSVSDIQLVNPNQLMLIGAQPGVTTLAVWDALGRLEERKVRVEKESHEQVLLNVLVAEVNRTKLENEGIDLSVAGLGGSLVGLPGNVATPYSPIIPLNIFPNLAPSPFTGVSTPSTPLGLEGTMGPGGTLMPLLLSNKITYALATNNGGFQSNAFFQFLESHQLARILAQPRILANSGEEAKFLSGGEIPIVIAQALNTSIVFKQFGTSVVFIPTVIGDDEIELVVKPEVSQPDYSQGVQMFGFNVPAFITQRAETQVRMKNNQTLIIAGLIQENIQRTVNKVPYMGDIPFAGALFRNTSYNRVKTELVITVTPQLVRPIPEGADVAKPTDNASMTYQDIRTRSLPVPDPSRPRLW